MTGIATTITAFSSSSSSNPSISLHAIPSKPSMQTLQPPSLSPSPSLSSLLSNNSLTVASAVQAVTMANATAQATRDAVSLALTVSQMAVVHEAHDLSVEEDVTQLPCQGPNAAGLAAKQRRKRRRRRLKSLDDDSGSHCFLQLLSDSLSSSYLTSKEEAELILYVKEGARLEAGREKFRNIEEYDPTMSQWAEAVGMKRGSLERALLKARMCREKISHSYRRLVIAVARPYLGKGLSLRDLVQEGIIGLLKGVEKFDHKKGCKLSTYVYWWIKQSIIKAISTKSRTIRLPGSMQGSMARIAEANNTLREQLGRWPTHDEIAHAVDVGVSIVKLVSERTRIPISLDQSMSSQGRITLKEIIPGPEETMPEAVVSRKHMKQDIDKLLKTLSEREECILRLYYGFNGENSLSCEEIGRLLNLSRERVRQLRGIALSKLKHLGISNSLKAYIV